MVECCANCRYLISTPKNNRYGEEHGGYKICEEKPLTDEEKEFRKDNGYYCQNGKPKKSEMVCMQRSYRNMIGTIHRHQCFAPLF